MSELSRIAWNSARHSTADIKRIQFAIGADPDGLWGPATQTGVEHWQLAHGLSPDGKVGAKTLEAMLADDGTPAKEQWIELTDAEIDGIMEATISVESAGRANPYAAANRNAEYEGWFDKPKRDGNGKKLRPAERADQPNHKPHKASKYGPAPSMIGLSHGPIQTTQDGGALGKVMAYWFDDAPNEYAETMTPDAAELLEVLTLPGKSGLRQGILRGPRVQTVEGADLWKSPWIERFAAAAEMPGYQRAQRRVMREDYFDPAIEICKKYGHSSQGALAVAFDCCVQYGAGGARSRFKQAGIGASILEVLDVLEKRGGSRARARREEILEHADIWVHYEDLVMCAEESP